VCGGVTDPQTPTGLPDSLDVARRVLRNIAS
jgi:hypothetical protein